MDTIYRTLSLITNGGQRVENFTYPTPRLDDGQIRLVRIRPRNSRSWNLCRHPMELDMDVFRLEEAPEYVALSYTWGPPRPGMRQYVTSDRRQIRLNDQAFKVFPNLLDGLLAISKTNFAENYLWIDAICINQRDSKEQASQVNRMDSIYKQAISTLVWLGESSSFDTKRIVRVIEVIRNIPPENWEQMDMGTQATTGIQIAEIRRRHRLPNAGTMQSMIRVFERNWFGRVWTVQEVSLSRKIIVLCGKIFLEWEDLVRCATILLDRGILGSFMMTIRAASSGHDISSSPVQLPMIKIGITDQMRQRCLEVSADKTPEFFDLETVLSPPTISPTILLFYFCAEFWPYSASDPRDKVFSLLGLVNHFMKPEDMMTLSIHPDYDVSSVDVYERLMQGMIEQTTGATCLVYICHPPETRNDELPSWVPDLSKPAGLNPIIWLSLAYNATFGSPKHVVGVRVVDHQLHCKGALLGSISTQGYGVSDLSAKLRRKDYSRGEFLGWTKLILAMEPTYVITGEPRVEAFWRTLLMNSVDCRSPAQWPDTLNFEPFSGYVLYLLARGFKAMRKGSLDMTKYCDAVEDIGVLASTGDILALPLTNPEHIENAAGLFEFAEWQSTLAGLGIDTYTSSIVDRMAADKLSRMQMFLSEMQKTMLHRKVVLSSAQHLALVPEWAREGDNLVIIAGCRFPLVTRPHTEDPMRCVLIGPAYVHGIMQGEAVMDAEWQDICIA